MEIKPAHEETVMSKRILIVDDDPSVVTSLSLVLKQAGFKSHGADRPESAFKLLEKKYYDLVLQDMNFFFISTGVGHGNASKIEGTVSVSAGYPNISLGVHTTRSRRHAGRCKRFYYQTLVK